MAKNDVLLSIDNAIAALQAARATLVAQPKTGAPAKTSSTKSSGKSAAVKGVRSEEVRQKMAEAQRKRWAKKRREDKKAAKLAAQN